MSSDTDRVRLAADIEEAREMAPTLRGLGYVGVADLLIRLTDALEGRSGAPATTLPEMKGDDGRRLPANPACPECGKQLRRVRNGGGYLNDEQSDSMRAGDWYCDTCSSNGHARSGFRYFWNRELSQSPIQSPADSKEES